MKFVHSVYLYVFCTTVNNMYSIYIRLILSILRQCERGAYLKVSFWKPFCDVEEIEMLEQDKWRQRAHSAGWCIYVSVRATLAVSCQKHWGEGEKT